MHQLLEFKYLPRNAGIEYANSLLTFFRHRYNINASELNRPGFPCIGHYQHHLIDDIQRVTIKIYDDMKPNYPQWWNSNTFMHGNFKTTESFGIVPILPLKECDKVSLADVDKYPPSIKYLALRQHSIVPVMPIHSNEEKDLFIKVLPIYANGNSNSWLEEMTFDWNCGILKTGTGPNDIALDKKPGVNQKIFKKIVKHLDDAYSLYLDIIKRKTILRECRIPLQNMRLYYY
jgi:hypothetical protein